MNGIYNVNQFTQNYPILLKVLVLFFVSFCSLYLLNALQLGSFKDAYGIFGHSAFASFVAAMFLYRKSKNTITVFLLIYIAIFIPNCLMALSNKDIIPSSKDFARVVAESNNLSVMLAVLLSVFLFNSSLIKGKWLYLLLRAVVFILLLLAALHFSAVLLYSFKYQQGPSFPVILSVFSTNQNEAFEYISSLNVGYYAAAALAVCLSLSFAIWICRRYIAKSIHVSSVVSNLVLLSISCAAILSLNYKYAVYSYSSTYAHLQIQKYYRDGILNRAQLLNSLNIDTSSVNSGLYVLVIGESLNKDHMSLYGYERKTTPWQDSLLPLSNFQVFNHVYSCDIFTALVLPMALTSRSQFNKDEVKLEDSPSIVELFRAAGFNVTWISNQGKFDHSDVPQTVIASTANEVVWTEDIGTTSYDDNILEPLDGVLKNKNNNHLIVIHLYGSHYTYAERYPQNIGKWKSNTLTDHYDNSILFNDQVLNKVLDKLLSLENFKAMIYVSDHGDEIGIGHNTAGFTYQMARVPFWIYFSDTYLNENPTRMDVVSSNKDRIWTNDMLFDVMCGVANIKSHPFYDPRNDITSTDYIRDSEELMIFDRYKISDDPFYKRRYESGANN